MGWSASGILDHPADRGLHRSRGTCSRAAVCGSWASRRRCGASPAGSSRS